MTEDPKPEAYGRCEKCDCREYKPESDYESGDCVKTRRDGSKCGHSFGSHAYTS